MSPEDFAARHPLLYHVTDPDALPNILRHGLLPTRDLLTLFEVSAAARAAIERQRRPAGVRLHHPRHGTAVITDNRPLSMNVLARCLDDGLTPEDWLLRLNSRVFFWCDPASVERLLAARLNRGRPRLVLVFDAVSLLRATGERAELTAINTGSTIRKAARRGLSTFTPLARHSYGDWQRLRGGLDRPKELTVTGGVADVGCHLLHRTTTTPASSVCPAPPLCRGGDIG